MTMADTDTLRSRLARKPIVVAPGVYDSFTALVATQAGFTTLYVSGAAIAYTRLGRPDIGLVSMSEVVETVTLIRDRVEAHLVVDADTGYGNALNVAAPCAPSNVPAPTRSNSRIRTSRNAAAISTARCWSRPQR